MSKTMIISKEKIQPAKSVVEPSCKGSENLALQNQMQFV